MFIAQIHCTSTVCLGHHLLMWDDVRPPDVTKMYCFSCPHRGRFVLTRIDQLDWHLRGSREARALLGSPAQLLEWDQRTAGFGAMLRFG